MTLHVNLHSKNENFNFACFLLFGFVSDFLHKCKFLSLLLCLCSCKVEWTRVMILGDLWWNVLFFKSNLKKIVFKYFGFYKVKFIFILDFLKI